MQERTDKGGSSVLEGALTWFSADVDVRGKKRGGRALACWVEGMGRGCPALSPRPSCSDCGVLPGGGCCMCVCLVCVMQCISQTLTHTYTAPAGVR